MIAYPDSIIGCPLRASFGYAPAQSVTVQPVTKGRSRNQLVDPNAVEIVDMTFDMQPSQFNAWQMFWAGIGHGTKWFTMDLAIDGLPLTTYEVHATGAFSATFNAMSWSVTLQVEAVP